MRTGEEESRDDVERDAHAPPGAKDGFTDYERARAASFREDQHGCGFLFRDAFGNKTMCIRALPCEVHDRHADTHPTWTPEREAVVVAAMALAKHRKLTFDGWDYACPNCANRGVCDVYGSLWQDLRVATADLHESGQYVEPENRHADSASPDTGETV